jgi:dihydrolipoamide dehydrogenase
MYDLAIIGGGPGGYVAAICGARHGLKVLLIEKGSLGGTCLNRGCIPTKSFVYDSKLLSTAKSSSVLKGAQALAIDPAKMVARKRQVVKTMVAGLQSLIQSNGIDVANGFGQLAAAGKVRVRQNDGSTIEYQARDIILANGSKPAVPPFINVDGQFVQTTDEVLDCEEIPDKLVIIGGGVIGIEMATIFLNLGVDVTILELLPDILLTEDKEIRQVMRRLLKKRGATLFLKAKARDLTLKGDKVELSFEDDTGALQTLSCERVLVATGRAPVLDGIDVQQLNLKMNGTFVKVNGRLKTNLPHVYAIGDLVGGMMLAHKASAEAETAVANILGGTKELKPERIPRCIWGVAEIGAVGLTEEEAKATRRKIKTGKFYFMGSGAAQAMGHTDGFVKIIGDAENGEILGAHIMGEHATDLIGDVVTTMGMESAVEDLARAIKPHPTLSETITDAALDWSGLAVHKPRKK